MKQRLYLLLTVLLAGILLISCSSQDKSSSEAENNQHDSIASDDQSNDSKDENDNKEENKSETNKSSKNDKSDNQSQKKKEANKNKTSKSDNTHDFTDELKMDKSNIKLPTDFPVDEDVKAKIEKNTSSVYTIDYQTESNQEVARLTGTLYESPDDANNDLQEFIEGKNVPKSGNETDLGHGITGYGEGAAGHAYFSWEEGNWTFSIRSLTADGMDNPAIAKKMVNYLEDHLLPPPKDTGVVYVDYPKDGNSVDVDIRWKENKMVYQIETNEVPLDALKMTTSMK